ncbi:hypothetical protein TNCT_617191 [Trichonephila clavata]|uniref:Uncharacterized protein n=1 Tax=Trichonephila clavata TaxID=2740835 RepID=A0A8X6F426_TRICU|nr:hypothetical protein TNCT_617191 [Trichonephila clavata]
MAKGLFEQHASPHRRRYPIGGVFLFSTIVWFAGGIEYDGVERHPAEPSLSSDVNSCNVLLSRIYLFPSRVGGGSFRVPLGDGWCPGRA